MPEDHEHTRRDGRLPDEWWERIVPLLPPRKPPPLACHRPRVEERKAMEAMVFVLRTGCQWHALHATGRCSRSSAPRRFQAWTAAGVFLARWTSGLVADDAVTGSNWAWLARAGAMTNAPRGGNTVGPKPTERGKSGAKRRVLTEGGGGPIGLAVEGAKRHDFKLVRETLESLPVKRPAPPPATPQGLGLDKGDDDDAVRDWLAAVECTAHLRAPGEEAKALTQDAGVRARRWVVERTPRWMHRFRRVLIRWDKNVRNELGCLHLACAYLTYRQSGLLG
jgi:putative transposase